MPLSISQVLTEIRRADGMRAATVRIHYGQMPVDNRYTIVRLHTAAWHAYRHADRLSAEDDCDIEGIPPSHGAVSIE